MFWFYTSWQVQQKDYRIAFKQAVFVVMKEIFLNPSKIASVGDCRVGEVLFIRNHVNVNLWATICLFERKIKEEEGWGHPGGLQEYDGICNMWSLYLQNEINMRWGDSKNEVDFLVQGFEFVHSNQIFTKKNLRMPMTSPFWRSPVHAIRQVSLLWSLLSFQQKGRYQDDSVTVFLG